MTLGVKCPSCNIWYVSRGEICADCKHKNKESEGYVIAQHAREIRRPEEFASSQVLGTAGFPFSFSLADFSPPIQESK